MKRTHVDALIYAFREGQESNSSEVRKITSELKLLRDQNEVLSKELNDKSSWFARLQNEVDGLLNDGLNSQIVALSNFIGDYPNHSLIASVKKALNTLEKLNEIYERLS